MLNLVLYQPDIPQNFGACLRLSACMGATIHVIEPCGFPLDDAKLRRAGMDYIAQARYVRHLNWDAFLDYRTTQNSEGCVASGEPQSAEGLGAMPPSARHTLDCRQAHPGRLMLLETDGKTRYSDMAYTPSDYIVIGRESAGTPRALYGQMDATLHIPMRAGVRSLNMAMSAGILVAEACRQLEWRYTHD
jgi:tRNA (cytidine/uridine-2'-O-)-methyltransferase